MLKIAKFTFNPLSENTFIFYKDGNAVVIDPGMYEKKEEEKFSKFLVEKGLKLEKIVNTHCHLDHVAGVFYLQNKYSTPFYMPVDEEEVLRSSVVSAQHYGLHLFKHVDEFNTIDNKGTIDILGVDFDILHVPGHSPGHLAYYSKEENVLINGDVLFKGSFGRYDLPGGDLELLKENIKTKLFTLPDETVVLCGHGPQTTIGEERESNMINQY